MRVFFGWLQQGIMLLHFSSVSSFCASGICTGLVAGTNAFARKFAVFGASGERTTAYTITGQFTAISFAIEGGGSCSIGSGFAATGVACEVVLTGPIAYEVAITALACVVTGSSHTASTSSTGCAISGDLAYAGTSQFKKKNKTCYHQNL